MSKLKNMLMSPRDRPIFEKPIATPHRFLSYDPSRP